jgi:hypothetical protein
MRVVDGFTQVPTNGWLACAEVRPSAPTQCICRVRHKCNVCRTGWGRLLHLTCKPMCIERYHQSSTHRRQQSVTQTAECGCTGDGTTGIAPDPDTLAFMLHYGPLFSNAATYDAAAGLKDIRRDGTLRQARLAIAQEQNGAPIAVGRLTGATLTAGDRR